MDDINFVDPEVMEKSRNFVMLKMDLIKSAVKADKLIDLMEKAIVFNKN